MDRIEHFVCTALGESVELTAERRDHIRNAHPADPAVILERLAEVLEQPDTALRSLDNSEEFLLSRKLELATGSKHIVAIIVEQRTPKRLWIVTAFVTRRLSRGGPWIAI